MGINTAKYQEILNELKDKATLVAVSKTKPIEDIKALYELGQRDFGENYVQELVEKQTILPHDIRWHFIGHLQSNKVKHIASFVHLIHGVDSLKLLQEINKQAAKNSRVIDCLLQVHIAKEETKFGLDEKELDELIDRITNVPMNNVRVVGLMGMASFSDDMNLVRSEFKYLKSLFDNVKSKWSAAIDNLAHGQQPAADIALSATYCELTTLSMGMSSDYQIALEEGSNMVRIGSLVFGQRN